MKSATHTPGPYVLEVPPVIANRFRYVVAHVGDKIVTVAEIRDLPDIWETNANANLFKAAPQLLAAARAALAEFGPDCKGPTIDALRDAIAAAEKP